jgi:PKD repeat protein
MLATLLSQPLLATQIHVPDEYQQIQAAINAAAGDTIRIAPGVYFEHDIQLRANVYLLGSIENPASVTIDAEFQDRVLVAYGLPAHSKIMGLRLIHGESSTSYGAGLSYKGQILGSINTQLFIEDCIFEFSRENYYALYFGGGGISSLTRCIIRNNRNIGLRFAGETNVTLQDCFIENNQQGGVWYNSSSHGNFTACLFAKNGGERSIWASGSNLAISECTIVASLGDGIQISSTTFSLNQSIIAFNRGTAAVCTGNSEITVSCIDVFGNSGGDYVDCLWNYGNTDGNFSMDPLFCRPAQGDWHLAVESPCLFENNSCDLPIGCFTAECDTPGIFVDFGISDTLVTVDYPVLFTNYSTEASALYWDLDSDGLIDSEDENPSWSYSQPGLYSVTLIVESAGLCDTLIISDLVHVVPLGLLLIPEDFSSLEAALNFAVDDDTISFAAGSYVVSNTSNPRDIVLIGRGENPTETILDAAGAAFIINQNYSGADLELINFTLKGSTAIAIDIGYNGKVSLKNCLITANTGSIIEADGSWNHNSAVHMENCIIAGNGSSHASGVNFMHFHDLDSLSIKSTIIANNLWNEEIGFSGEFPVIEISCTNIYLNSGDTWEWPLAAWQDTLGNMSADPFFVDPTNGNWHLASDSPCLPDANDCGSLIGCFPSGGESATVPAWFRIAPYIAIAPVEIHPLAIRSDQEVVYEWDINADGIFDEEGFDHPLLFNEPGSYDITLRTTSPNAETRTHTIIDAVIAGGDSYLVPDDFPTIAEGLAQLVPGDTLWIDCGTYLEHGLTPGAGVIIAGVNLISPCVTIDGQDNWRILDGTNSDNTEIYGISFQNGLSAEDGGAMIAGRLGRIENCDFNRNSAESGGAISFEPWYVDGPRIENCKFVDNTATLNGGAIVGEVSNLENSRFMQNHAGSMGGAIYGDCESEVLACVFYDNSASAGGAVYIYDTDFRECEFRENQATDGGGGGLSGTRFNLFDCKFIDNTCTTYGGALENDLEQSSYGYVRLTNCYLRGNSAGSVGGAIKAERELEITGCTIVDNNSVAGSAIAFTNLVYNPEISNSIIAYNTGSSPLQGIFPHSHYQNDIQENCIWGNEGENWELLEYYLGHNCNMQVDPLFCDTVANNYYLLSDSPCREENNTCGALIGNADEDCDVSVDESEIVAADFVLLSNYPNPFNPVTTVNLITGTRAEVTLQVFNLLGQKVITLYDGKISAGNHNFQFDGSPYSSGVYVIQLEINNQTLINKMLLLK